MLSPFLARPKGFCLGTAVPIASLTLVAAAKKQSTGLFFYAWFESLRFSDKKIRLHFAMHSYFWPARRDSNPRSSESESAALSSCATGGYNRG